MNPNLESINPEPGIDLFTWLDRLQHIYNIKTKSALRLMAEKNMLNFECLPLDQKINGSQVLEFFDLLDQSFILSNPHIENFINNNINQKQQTMKVTNNQNGTGVQAPAKSQNAEVKKDPFANLKKIEAPDGFDGGFITFDTPGDKIRGFISGTAMIPSGEKKTPEKRFLITDEEGTTFCLPGNYQLMNKLNFREQNHGGKLSKENSFPVIIEFLGKKPHPSKPDQEIAEFDVQG